MSRVTAIRSIMLLWAGSVGGGILTFLNQVVQARELGPAAYGTFAAALGIVMLLSPLASFGLGGLWLRLFGLEGWNAMRWLRRSLQYALLSTTLVILAVMVWAITGPHDQQTGQIIAILSVVVVGQASLELISARLQLEGRYRQLSLWQFTPHLLRLLLLVALVWAARDKVTPWLVALIYSSISVAMTIAGIAMMRKMYHGEFHLTGHGPNPEHRLATSSVGIREVAAQAWPFGAAGVFHLIYFQSDIILLKYMQSDEAAGLYGVAYTIMAAAYILPSVVYQKFLLPKIHRWAVHDKDRFRESFRTGSRVMVILGIVTMVAIMLLSPVVVPALFGNGYGYSVDLLYILALAAPIRFLATSVGSVLVTQNFMKLKVKLMGLTAAVNVALNIILIPLYGATGAAISTVASEVLLLTLYFCGVRIYFKEQNEISGAQS